MPTKRKKRPVGRPVTGMGTTGARVELKMTKPQRKSLDAHAKLRDVTTPELVRNTLDEAGLFKPPIKLD